MSGIGAHSIHRHLQSSHRAEDGVYALSGHIPDGRSSPEGHPNEGGPGRFARTRNVVRLSLASLGDVPTHIILRGIS
jgi:hypothetical protein